MDAGSYITDSFNFYRPHIIQLTSTYSMQSCISKDASPQVGPWHPPELKFISRLHVSVPLGENGSFEEWAVWHFTPLISLSPPPPALPLNLQKFLNLDLATLPSHALLVARRNLTTLCITYMTHVNTGSDQPNQIAQNCSMKDD